jgi:hypothetical protein
VSAICTPLPQGGQVLSNVLTLDDGARAALLHVPGLFRLDVCPQQDTLRTVLRNLTLPQQPVSDEDSGGDVPVVIQGDGLQALGPRPAHLTLGFTLAGNRVEIVVATRQDAASGRTTFTAQASLRPFSPA